VFLYSVFLYDNDAGVSYAPIESSLARAAAHPVIDTSQEAHVPQPRRRSVNIEIQAIRRSLAAVVRALGRLGPALEATARPQPGPARLKRRMRLSPERRAALQLQGQYIGHMRNLPQAQQARIRALRAKKGVRAAIRYAKSLSAKR
jgi:hypothetical protein